MAEAVRFAGNRWWWKPDMNGRSPGDVEEKEKGQGQRPEDGVLVSKWLWNQ